MPRYLDSSSVPQLTGDDQVEALVYLNGWMNRRADLAHQRLPLGGLGAVGDPKLVVDVLRASKAIDTLAVN